MIKVALAASDLIFCLYNLPLTAYQVEDVLVADSAEYNDDDDDDDDDDKVDET